MEFAQFDSLAADDFTVPAGETWQLESALVRGQHFGSTETTQWNVTVFADAGGAPGAEIFAATLTGPGYDDPTIPLTAVPTLQPGTYWLGVQAVLAGGSFGDPQQWFWAENDEQSGSRAVWRNPGGGISPSCPTFTTRSACLSGHTAPDQSFRLSGTRTTTVTPTPPAGEDPACTTAKSKLDKAKAKLKKAKEKAKDAKGKAKDKAKAKVRKAKAKAKAAKAKVKEACS